MRDDPLEQTNLASQQPQMYDELLAIIVAHARTVEAANPAIASRPARNVLRQCDRIPRLGAGAQQHGAKFEK